MTDTQLLDQILGVVADLHAGDRCSCSRSELCLFGAYLDHTAAEISTHLNGLCDCTTDNMGVHVNASRVFVRRMLESALV